MRRSTARSGRPALSVVEVLVVVAIIAVLLSLVFPATQIFREQANRRRCADNLKQIALACHAADTLYGKLPPGIDGYPSAYPDHDKPMTAFGNAQWHLLPFLGQGGLWQNSMDGIPLSQQVHNLGYHWGAPGPQSSAWNGGTAGHHWGWNGSRYAYIAPASKVFVCPSDPSTTGEGFSRDQNRVWGSSYGFNYQVFGMPNLNGNASAWWPNWNGARNLGMISGLDGTSGVVGWTEKYGACHGFYATPANPSSPSPTPGSQGGSLAQWWAHQGAQWSPSVAANWVALNGRDAYTGPWRSALFQVQPAWNGTDPLKEYCVQGLAQSPHAGSILVGWLDGSVRPLAQTVKPATWWMMLTPDASDSGSEPESF